jgi:hypothetical protein
LSWTRCIESGRKGRVFVTKFYKRKDVRFKYSRLQCIQSLEYLFKIALYAKQAPVYRSIQIVKKSIQFAIAQNFLHKGPFHLYKNKKHKTIIVQVVWTITIIPPLQFAYSLGFLTIYQLNYLIECRVSGRFLKIQNHDYFI